MRVNCMTSCAILLYLKKIKYHLFVPLTNEVVHTKTNIQTFTRNKNRHVPKYSETFCYGFSFYY